MSQSSSTDREEITHRSQVVIGFLRGKLLSKNPPHLLLDVNGVGYEIEAPMTAFYNLPALGEEVRLHTHLVIREDVHILFGFAAESDRALFRNLIKVNGVGPKMALTLLSGLNADDFSRCIHDNDVTALVRLPGIGKKTAERLIIEMKDRISAPGEVLSGQAGQSPSRTGHVRPVQEAISALCSLGYKPQEAESMTKAISAEGKSCEEIIRLALQGAAK